jgi:hypothetical protein
MKKLTKLSALFFFAVIAFSSCKKELQEMIQNDLVFSLDANAFLQNQVQLQFVNANSSKSKTIPNATVTISGKDALMVYDINGSKQINVSRQFANLAVSPGKPLTPTAPAIFKVHATATGFLPYEQEIEVTNLDSFLTYTFEMVEINNPTAGIINNTSNLDLSAKKIMTIGQEKPNAFSGKIQFKANTAFFNNEGQEVTGLSKFDWRQFDTKDEIVVANIEHLVPNYTNNITIDQTASDIAFLPFGYAQLAIANGNNKVKSFNQPAQVDFNIANGTIDRTIDQPIKAGDIVGVYQLKSSSNSWELINEVPVVAQAGSMKVSFPVLETGDFAIASARSRGPVGGNAPNTCTTNLGLRFTRANNINTLHYIEVVNSNNVVVASASDVQVFHNGTYNFSTRLPNTNVTVKVYQFEKVSFKGNVIASFGPFSSCTRSTSNRVTLNITASNPIARFELDTYCADSKLFYYHDGRIQYKVKGAPDNTYRDMGLARKSGRISTEIIPASGAVPVQTNSFSFLETDRLVSGTVYTFRTEISGRHKTSRRTIKQVFTRDRVYNLNSGEFSPYTGTIPSQYNFFKFDRGYWIAPDNACSIFGY